MINKIRENAANILIFLFLCFYIYLFLADISVYWYWESPLWITDDAMQQVYEFHEVYHPGIFANDIITQSMSLYLAPLHYWLCYFITWICTDPIIMAHIVMAIQVFLTAIFIFLTINYCAGFFPACLGALWFMHSGILIQRLTGGLPRGWISPLVAIYLYLASKKSHIWILFTIFLACLLNSLAAFMLIAAYSVYLFFNLLDQNTRKEFIKPVIYFIICCPLYLLTTIQVVKRPDNIGEMVTYKQALEMPSLTKEGRFKIAPLVSVSGEFKSQVFQIFTVDYQKVLRPLKPYAPLIVFSFALIICLIAFRNKIPPVPKSIYTFLIAVLCCYFAARLFAFMLYMPNRYLRFPISIFFICFFCISLWKIFQKKIYSYISLGLLAAYVVLGTGSGLQKEAGYNYKKGQDGHIFEWIRKYTPEDSTIAGYPNFMDPLPLFAVRKVYISNETAHPFYDKYFAVVTHRLEVTLRAHFAKNLKEFLDVIKDEKIDYFIFDRKKFSPEELKKLTYFAPFDKLIENLTKDNLTNYAYFELPKDLDPKFPALVFSDSNTALIDIAKLKQSLK